MGKRGKQVLSPVLLYKFFIPFFVQKSFVFSLYRNSKLFLIATEILFSK